MAFAAIRAIAENAPGAINATREFNHGLGYTFYYCVQGMVNLWDKIQCGSSAISFESANKSSVIMDINGTRVLSHIPGAGLSGGIWANFTSMTEKPLLFDMGNHTYSINLKFLNATIAYFVNGSAAAHPIAANTQVAAVSFPEPFIGSLIGLSSTAVIALAAFSGQMSLGGLRSRIKGLVRRG